MLNDHVWHVKDQQVMKIDTYNGYRSLGVNQINKWSGSGGFIKAMD